MGGGIGRQPQRSSQEPPRQTGRPTFEVVEGTQEYPVGYVHRPVGRLEEPPAQMGTPASETVQGAQQQPVSMGKPEEREQKAATKLQAVSRGRRARKEVAASKGAAPKGAQPPSVEAQRPACEAVQDVCIVVTGADGCGIWCNGTYCKAGMHNEKPMFKMVGGEGIIYYADSWKINSSGSTGGWWYSIRGSDPMPPAGRWTTEGASASTPPVVSFINKEVQAQSVEVVQTRSTVGAAGGRAKKRDGANGEAKKIVEKEELQVLIGSDWTSYPAEVQKKARKARLRGRDGFDLTREDGKLYHVDLTTMKQVNKESKRCRHVRWSTLAASLKTNSDSSDGSLDSEDVPKCWQWDHENEPREGWRLDLIYANGAAMLDTPDPAGTAIKSALEMALPEDLKKGRDMKDCAPHTQLVLQHLWRIQHKQRWLRFMAEHRYLEEQVAIIKEHFQRDDASPEEQGIVVTQLDSVFSCLPGKCEGAVNEKLLLHGTQPQHVLTILQNGMNPHFSSMKGLFGAGVYLADRPEKSNQYAAKHQPRDPALDELSEVLYPPGGVARHADAVFYMFVCRAALGFPNVTDNAEQKSKLRPYEPVFPSPEDRRRLSFVPGLKPQRAFHSLIGSKPGFRFREYVVYEGGYIYPEYLLAYARR